MHKALWAGKMAYQQSYPQQIWTARKTLCNQGLSVKSEGELQKNMAKT
jgi:hypothetical protein